MARPHGTAVHLDTEMLSRNGENQDVVIQYKSAGAAMAGLLSGELPVILASLVAVTPHLSNGKARALRSHHVQSWHTSRRADRGRAFPASKWSPGSDDGPARYGRGGLAVIELNAGINKALQDPTIRRTLESEGMMARGGYAAAVRRAHPQDYDRWAKVVKDANIKRCRTNLQLRPQQPPYRQSSHGVRHRTGATSHFFVLEARANVSRINSPTQTAVQGAPVKTKETFMTRNRHRMDSGGRAAGQRRRCPMSIILSGFEGRHGGDLSGGSSVIQSCIREPALAPGDPATRTLARCGTQ